MKAGFCAGLVASEEDRLKFPRSIMQVPGTRPVRGRRHGRLGPHRRTAAAARSARAAGAAVQGVARQLEYPFGLVHRPGQAASTPRPRRRSSASIRSPTIPATVETIMRRMPGQAGSLARRHQARRERASAQAVRLRPERAAVRQCRRASDDCITSAPITKPCAAGEGASAMASIWLFTPPAGGIFPALKPGDPDPPHSVFARGLRNSMALALHPNFPDAGFAFLQGENGARPARHLQAERGDQRDRAGQALWLALLLRPVDAEPRIQAAFLQDRRLQQSLHGQRALQGADLAAAAARRAARHALLHGAKFPELEGKLLVGLHGYRPTGSRVLVYDVDDHGFPKSAPPPVHYNVSCAADRPTAFRPRAARSPPRHSTS